jgi:hypothetical protein
VCRSLSHGSRLSRRISLPLASGYLLAVSISDTLVPIPNDILFHILYDSFALAPRLQYTNSGNYEFIPDHRSGHSSFFSKNQSPLANPMVSFAGFAPKNCTGIY